MNTNRVREAGYEAAVAGSPRVPALCPVYREAIEGMEVGTGGAELASEWVRGYQQRCDEEAAAILNN